MKDCITVRVKDGDLEVEMSAPSHLVGVTSGLEMLAQKAMEQLARLASTTPSTPRWICCGLPTTAGHDPDCAVLSVLDA